jgi:hypothetical protein
MYRAAIILVSALAFLRPIEAHSQRWEYQSYPDGENILQSPEKPAAPGYITLDESGGAPVFTMSAGRVTKCFSGTIPAKVERTAQTTIITVRRDLPGCFSARFVINNDGSGGRREVIRNGKWVWDGLEHGLRAK